MVEYIIQYHIGTPSSSYVIASETIYADNDIKADKIRQDREKHIGLYYDFNLLCQAYYLREQNLIKDDDIKC
jgi:hypothetical protein